MQANRPTCVLHPDRPAAYTVQGIVVCTEDYEAYREEYLRAQQTNSPAPAREAGVAGADQSQY